MNKTFYNAEAGCELATTQRAVSGFPHIHTCTRCGQKWNCSLRFCKRMQIGYVEAGISYQPVPWLCDSCAGIETKMGRAPVAVTGAGGHMGNRLHNLPGPRRPFSSHHRGGIRNG